MFADLYSANAIPVLRFLPGTKIFHSAQFSMTKSQFFIQPLLPTMPRVTIPAYMACLNNVYDQLQNGDRVHRVATVFLFKGIQNWKECVACMLRKSSCSYLLARITSPTPARLFNGLSSLAMPHVVRQGCG